MKLLEFQNKYKVFQLEYLVDNVNINPEEIELTEKNVSNILNNPNLTIEYVRKNIKIIETCRIWKKFISMHSNIQPKDIIDIADWKYLSKNPNLTIEFIKKHIDKPWNIPYLAINKNLQPNDISETFGFINVYFYICRNPNLTIEYINKHFILFNEDICRNPNIQPEDIIKYYPDRYYLSDNPNLTLDFVKKYPKTNENDWNWISIVTHKNIKPEDLVNMFNNTIDKKYWKYIFMNPNLTIKFVKANKHKYINWKDVFRHPNIQPEEIMNNFKQKIIRKNLCYLSYNPNLSVDFMDRHFNMIKNEFNWYAVANNPLSPRIKNNKLIKYKRLLSINPGKYKIVLILIYYMLTDPYLTIKEKYNNIIKI